MNKFAGVGVRRDLADFIRRRQSDIVEQWERSVRELPAARELSRPALLDHVPELLRKLADSLDDIADGKSPESMAGMPEAHAIARLDAGFDLREVIAEYAVLRSTIETLWYAEEPERINRKEITALDATIDGAIAASVDRYTKARERALVALDRISSGAFAAGSEIESLLPTLLGVLVDTTESSISSPSSCAKQTAFGSAHPSVSTKSSRRALRRTSATGSRRGSPRNGSRSSFSTRRRAPSSRGEPWAAAGSASSTEFHS